MLSRVAAEADVIVARVATAATAKNDRTMGLPLRCDIVAFPEGGLYLKTIGDQGQGVDGRSRPAARNAAGRCECDKSCQSELRMAQTLCRVALSFAQHELQVAQIDENAKRLP